VFSPNGKQLAVVIPDGKESNVWIYDFAAGTSMRRLTFGGRNANIVWTRDGQKIVFTSEREADAGIFWQPADGSGSAERLTKSEPNIGQRPESWSPDGKILIVGVRSAGTYSTATVVPGADPKPKIVMGSTTDPSVSPDGGWIAYKSNESGRQEVYVQSFPPAGAKYQISNNTENVAIGFPLWSPDGRQLFYLKDDLRPGWQILSVDVQTKPAFVSGKTVPLPIEGIFQFRNGPRSYDISPDGKYFVVMLTKATAEPGKTPPEQINLTLNWFDELKQRVPVKP
jgi:Tol biopolymer transport system component